MKEIYIVVYGEYSDWKIRGYFTNEDDANKYCALHKEENYYVMEIPCMDGQEDFSKVELKYQYTVMFSYRDSGWKMRDMNECDVYSADRLRDNLIIKDLFNFWIEVAVNISKKDEKLAEKIAQDTLYKFLDFCENEPTDEAVKHFNDTLRRE